MRRIELNKHITPDRLTNVCGQTPRQPIQGGDLPSV
jgi:hypothetical protein